MIKHRIINSGWVAACRALLLFLAAWPPATSSAAAATSSPVPDIVINEFVAENTSGLKDEKGQPEDWIELFNRGDTAVNLEGWALTDAPHLPDQWTFPAVTLAPRQYLVVFASGNNLKPTQPSGKLHTNFKLNLMGEYLGLFSADMPRQEVSSLGPQYPEQRYNYSYGRDSFGEWRYFAKPTPGIANGDSVIATMVAPVHFSVPRGQFKSPFYLSLATETPGADIRYTLDGSVPTETNGVLYTNFIYVNVTRMVRAAAFRPNLLPSRVITHTYLYGQGASRLILPALSLVTATNNLFGPTGIMETKPRNTTKHGIAWERPVSAELIYTNGSEGFALDCGLRIQGGNYVRQRYDPRGNLPFSKYSFRLYFRGDYGAGQLDYPLFPGSPVQTFDRVVLRAGMNDPTNPFIVDELVRRLFGTMGQVTSHGTFVNLYLNGVYKGYYNPTERIDRQFLEAWHGGGENWDLIAQGGEVRAGDATAWNSLRTLVNKDLTLTNNYLAVEQRLDLENFIDYLLVNIYGATSDWPWNNWRAGRERVTGAKFRFYVWDAEWAFGYRNGVTWNTLANELATADDISQFYKKLKTNPEFRLLFADRIHRHFFNDGALTDTRIRACYDELKSTVAGTISGFNNSIATSWIPRRRTNIFKHLTAASLMQSSNAPIFNQFGGWVPRGFKLTMTVTNGFIYYTTNGTDPRVRFTNKTSPDSRRYFSTSPLVLNQSVSIKARCLNGTNWSALTDAIFYVDEAEAPLVISEIMLHPLGGETFEFVELLNAGTVPLDLRGLSFRGITFRFPESTPPLAAGQRLVLSSAMNPAAFAQRYPGISVAGTFQGSLAQGNPELRLVDRTGRTLISIAYLEERNWSLLTTPTGYSLEFVNPKSNPNDPAHWRLSAGPGGTPGSERNVSAYSNSIRINEIMADNATAVPQAGAFPDWIELQNTGAEGVDLSGWSLTDDEQPRRFVFPPDTHVPANHFLVVWCDANYAASGLHTGFALNRRGERVSLYDPQTNCVDALSFGPQITDMSLGRTGPDHSWALNLPTPGLTNTAATVAAITNLMINEYMANGAPEESDWIELYNRHALLPISLQGIYIGTSNALYQYHTPAFLPPRGFFQWFADEAPGADHLAFKLPASGGYLLLRDRTGKEFQRVTYGLQQEGISEGRLPDGANTWSPFPQTASPGAKNYKLTSTGVLLNEILAYSSASNDPPLPIGWGVGRERGGWIELYNTNRSPVDLTGMSLSLGRREPGQWRFPPSTRISPNGYLLMMCDATQLPSTQSVPPLQLGRSLSDAGGGVYLFNAVGQLIDLIEYGLQLPNQSIGRSTGSWQLLAYPTPAFANSGDATLGSPANLRLNEWSANSPSQPDWFELHNLDPQPVSLSGLYLTDDPSLAGQRQYQIGPLSFIAGGGYVTWIADGETSQGRNHVCFKLDDQGETLRLYASNGAILDSIEFGIQTPGISEGRWPDGADQITSYYDSATPGFSNSYTASTPAPLQIKVIETTRTGQVRLHLLAPLNSARYLLQGSTNLVDWVPLQTQPAVEGAVHFIETPAFTEPTYFYRAVQFR